MSKKKKLIFRVGTGLAATSMALALGTGCPKNDHPNVNTVAPMETNSAPEDPVTDPVPAPATNNGSDTNNAGTNGTNGMTTGALEPKMDPPRVNTIPSKNLEKPDE